MLWLILIMSFVVITAIIYFVAKMTQLNQQLTSSSQQVNQQINSINQQIAIRLSETSQAVRDTTKVFGDVQKSLGSLGETNKHILDVSKDVAGLQELLRAPKFRGQMGETWLENLLSQVVPKDHYRMQYRFKSGEAVDAAIKLGEHIVPIDAKFSLENFKKMLEEDNEQLKNSYRKEFIRNVKVRVDEIASKYILPQENTYDFAFMYIPAENVYYEIIVKEDLMSYFIAKRVFPVSPSIFYAYLQVICLGFKGLKIEENAKAILKGLSALTIEIKKFKDDFDTLGMHLVNATNKYAESQKRLERFLDRLANLTNIEGNNKLEAK